MSENGQPGFENESRDNARAVARAGISELARAFNHCDRGEMAYRYAGHVQSRFLELAGELVQLIERGAIERNPVHAQFLKAQAARKDKALQAVLLRSSRGTPIRSR